MIDNADLAAPPAVFGQDRLGLLTLDAGRYEVTCHGRVPADVLAFVSANPGATGSTLLSHFGAPPYGVPPNVLKAVMVGLLRGSKVRVQAPGGVELTSVRDEGARELLKETGLRKAEFLPNTKEVLEPRDRNAICKLFKDHFSTEVARDNEAIADAVLKQFKGARERLNQVAILFRKLPGGTEYPPALAQLERALEACRSSRQVEPVAKAMKSYLPVLQDGLSLLRRIETDLTEEACATLKLARDTEELVWPELEPFAPADVKAAVAEVKAHLAVNRPWEDLGELAPRVAVVRDCYREQRQRLLSGQTARVDATIERIKRRDGFDRLNPDQRHQVLNHLREGAPLATGPDDLAPPLRLLDDLFAARLESAEHKAQAHLDEVLETLGENPTVEVDLELRGSMVRSASDLERLLSDVQARILPELEAKHRVRLK